MRLMREEAAMPPRAAVLMRSGRETRHQRFLGRLKVHRFRVALSTVFRLSKGLLAAAAELFRQSAAARPQTGCPLGWINSVVGNGTNG